jgi:hypothetical protein
MAFYHYLRIPIDARKEGAWNNIGAAARSLELRIQSVAAYQRSKKIGGTRAVSNLAYILIDEGFIAEAQEMCVEALKDSNCDGRVGSALGSIEPAKNKEDESRKKVLEEADKQRTFRAELGLALTEQVPAELNGSVWKTPECEVTVTVKGTSFRATGKFTKTSGLGLLSSIYLHGGLGQQQKTTNMLVTYEGEIQGRGCVLRKTVREDGTQESVLMAAAGDEVSLIVEKDVNAIREMRKPEKGSVAYAAWTRT